MREQFMQSFKAFLQSPTNRTGLAMWLGTAMTAAIQYFLLGLPLPPGDLLGIVLGFVKILEPETAVTLVQLEKAVLDVAQLLETRNYAGIVTVAADMGTIAADVAHG